MIILPEDLLKLFLAILAGGIIGIDRELHHKAAGFRTIILICLGATLFTILDKDMSASGRIAANIITGVGFIGAGVILHDENRVKGLTTSASVWVSAAVGMAIGSGEYILSGFAVLLILVVMRLFVLFEARLDSQWDVRQYRFTFSLNSQKMDWLENQMSILGLKIVSLQKMKGNGQIVCLWTVSGSTAKQNLFVDSVMLDPEILDFTW